MFRRRTFLRIVSLAAIAPALLLTAPSWATEPIVGKATHVTLFRGQAQVTRTIPIEGNAGSLEVVIGNLPEQVVPDSLFAEGGDAVEIRAVRFRTRAVGE